MQIFWELPANKNACPGAGQANLGYYRVLAVPLSAGG